MKLRRFSARFILDLNRTRRLVLASVLMVFVMTESACRWLGGPVSEPRPSAGRIYDLRRPPFAYGHGVVLDL